MLLEGGASIEDIILLKVCEKNKNFYINSFDYICYFIIIIIIINYYYYY